MTRPGQPEGWNERVKDTGGPALPAGAEFYSTPGHGFLRVDTRIHAVTLSDYDYQDGPHHVLLEEDCSAPAWLDEYNRKHEATRADIEHAVNVSDGSIEAESRIDDMIADHAEPDKAGQRIT